VVLLALLLPRPSQPAPGPSVSTAFAWTKLRKRTVALMAAAIVIAGILGARVALADQPTVAAVSAESRVTLPPTVISPTPEVAPPPSTSPSPSVSASPSPSASHTPKKKKTPPQTTPPSSASPSPSVSSSPPPPPPVPVFEVLVPSAQDNPGTCAVPCDTMVWRVTARATGSGSATLHVQYFPSNVDGTPQQKDPSESWTVPVTVPGKLSWSNSAGRAASCGKQDYLVVKAWITAGGKTLISKTSGAEECFIPVIQ
jgi:hypothetical protein